MTKGSKYDLSMSLMYVRLAFQSANPDQAKALATVDNIAGKTSDKRERIRLLALALAALMATTPAQAKCHHFSIWKNPWPQSCTVTGKAAAVSLRGRGAAAADLWTVEITRMPDDIARNEAIEALKAAMNK